MMKQKTSTQPFVLENYMDRCETVAQAADLAYDEIANLLDEGLPKLEKAALKLGSGTVALLHPYSTCVSLPARSKATLRKAMEILERLSTRADYNRIEIEESLEVE